MSDQDNSSSGGGLFKVISSVAVGIASMADSVLGFGKPCDTDCQASQAQSVQEKGTKDEIDSQSNSYQEAQKEHRPN